MTERAPLDVINPRTGATDYRITPLDAGAVAAAAAGLRAAQPAWAARSLPERLGALADLAGAVVRHPVMAALEADTGRRAVSAIEVRSIAGMVAKWARLAPDLIAAAEGERVATSMPGVTGGTRLHPYGLVGIISPWNFPLLLALTDAVPALSAGCAVLVKPSEVTPRFIAPLMAAIAEVPALAGVLRVIEGDAATGAALIDAVDYVCFTGSVATGRKVATAAAAAFVPASLELGGKDPLIVTASADPVAAARIALRASVIATGQACQSIERVYVDRQVAEPFLAELVAAAGRATLNADDIGRGDIGPFILARQADIVAAQLADAVAHGARILAGGTVETIGGGRYLRPTVVVDVHPGMALMREETFGPVIPVTVVGSVDEAVALANGGDFGLSAAVIAATADEAEAVGVRLRAGAVSINDAALTNLISDVEKASFGLSGLGPSRMGASGLMRFFRRQALLRQEGTPLPLAAYAEAGA